MQHQQRWFGTRGLRLCRHLVAAAIISAAHTGRYTWNFPHLEKGGFIFFFRRLGLRNCYFLPLCSGETCRVMTTQPLIDKWSLEAGNSFSGTNSLFLCAKQHNIKQGVISCSSMRYNCLFCQRSQAGVERAKHSEINTLQLHCYLNLKYSNDHMH